MSTHNSGGALRATGSGGPGQNGSYGEEADREREDADDEEREGAEHTPEGVAKSPAAAGRRGGDLGLRHCGRVDGCVGGGRGNPSAGPRRRRRPRDREPGAPVQHRGLGIYCSCCL